MNSTSPPPFIMSSLESLKDNVKDVSEFEVFREELSSKLQQDQK